MPDTGFADRQTPAPGEVFLDHVGWYVPDMDAASAAFERLGFRLTPFTRHAHERPSGEQTASGTANRCAMLELGYLEILTHVPGLATPLADQLRAGLDRYTGLHLIAFTCADAEAERARLEGAGFDPLPVAHLRRPVRADDGAEATVAFSVVRLPPGPMAEGRIQMLTQDTPDLTWQPSTIARDNAIDALSGVVVCTTDAAEAAARFARFTGHQARRAEASVEIELDRGRVILVTPQQWRALAPDAAVPADPHIAAITMRSHDLAATRAFLAGRGVRHNETRAGAIVVDAAEAMGATLVIHGPGAAWPKPAGGAAIARSVSRRPRSPPPERRGASPRRRGRRPT